MIHLKMDYLDLQIGGIVTGYLPDGRYFKGKVVAVLWYAIPVAMVGLALRRAWPWLSHRVFNLALRGIDVEVME